MHDHGNCERCDAKVKAAELLGIERAAAHVNAIADQVDMLAEEHVNHDFIHGLLTDSTCSLRNVAENIRRLGS